VVAGHLNVGAPPQTVDTFAIDLAKGSVASTTPAKATKPAGKRSPQAKTKAKAKAKAKGGA